MGDVTGCHNDYVHMNLSRCVYSRKHYVVITHAAYCCYHFELANYYLMDAC